MNEPGRTSRDYTIANLDHRFGAFIIDWHFRTIPVALWGLWILVEWFPAYWRAAGQGGSSLEVAWQLLLPVLEQPGVALFGWLSLAAYLLYHPLIELVMHGDSPGKRMMRITVVSVNGARPAFRQILLRNAWRALEFLPVAYAWGVISILRSDENARTGDIHSATRVVAAQP